MSDSDLPEPAGHELFRREENLPRTFVDRTTRESVEKGLPCASSLNDPEISTFARASGPCYSGPDTFFKLPYAEDVRSVKDYDVAFLGIPYDIGTTYRSGARFGPQGVRRASAVYPSIYAYDFEHGIDLFENVSMCDAGDVFTTGDIEKSFDQISRAVAHLYTSGCFPVMVGGDHSIGYPDLRGIAPFIDGKIGLIHLDRHLDTGKTDVGSRMHSCPWYHACGIDNISGDNVVQIGIGGWQVARKFMEGARERGTHVIPMSQVDELGIDKVAEMALEIAWKGASAVYLSFDVDSMDGAFCPGTGWPQPGGFLPREALKLLRLITREGLCGFEVAEVAPDKDVNDITSLMAVNATLEVLSSLHEHGHLPTGRKPLENADLEAWKGS